MKTNKRRSIPLAASAVFALMLAMAAHGETDLKGSDAASNLQSLVTAALNPVAMMVKLPFQNDFDFGGGLDQGTMRYTLNFQPVIPFALDADWNLLTRSIVPFIDQPSVGSSVPSATGLGDISPSIFLSPAKTRQHFWGIGPAVTFPSGTAPELTSGQWCLGPALVCMATPDPWMIGVVANHQWSVGGWGDKNVSATYIQPLVIYHLPKGWYLVSVPVITADWEADAGNVWTVPVGGGVGNIVKIGKLPVNLQLQAFYNVERPDDGPDWQVRFQFQFLFAK